MKKQICLIKVTEELYNTENVTLEKGSLLHCVILAKIEKQSFNFFIIRHHKLGLILTKIIEFGDSFLKIRDRRKLQTVKYEEIDQIMEIKSFIRFFN